MLRDGFCIQEVIVTANGSNRVIRSLILFFDLPKYFGCHSLIRNEFHIKGCNIHISFEERHFSVIEHALEKGPALIHVLYDSRIRNRGQCGTESKPSRQVEAALHPRENPGNGAYA